MTMPTSFQRGVLTLALVALGLAQAGGAQARPELSMGPFVNVNGKYVLYTFPSAPYLKQGLVYVPLVSFAELLGIRVTQKAKHRPITLLLNGKTTTFRQSGRQLVGGKANSLRVPTESLGGGELAVALPSLLDILGIKYRAEAFGLRITDKQFLNINVPPGQQFEYANGLPNLYKDWDYCFVVNG
ncbi:stalk domain-containing protein [Deinococcus sp.]|uniref:stalk domain-containing protein n=1 Tax=Deinococcus sp. TaxID=47478 RepID=UPI003B58F3EB